MRVPERAAIALLCLLAACTSEERVLVPEQPYSPPTNGNDPRIRLIEANAYQTAQGGRYFTWYSCAACHANHGRHWPASNFSHVYAAIGHRGFDRRIPAEQRWQITSYVRSLQTMDPVRRARQDRDTAGEPTAFWWKGPL